MESYFYRGTPETTKSIARIAEDLGWVTSGMGYKPTNVLMSPNILISKRHGPGCDGLYGINAFSRPGAPNGVNQCESYIHLVQLLHTLKH